MKKTYDYNALDSLYKMQEKDINMFAHTLATAFKGYALFEYFSQYKYSEKKMVTFWKVMLKASRKRSIQLATDEICESVAVVFEPGYKGPGLFSYIRHGGLKLILDFGLISIRRMIKFEKFANKVKKEFIKNNTWYFYSLAIVPSRRHTGESSKLVRPILQFLKDNNQTCYLETLNEDNVNIYEHYGFSLVATMFVPNSKMTLYGMIKE